MLSEGEGRSEVAADWGWNMVLRESVFDPCTPHWYETGMARMQRERVRKRKRERIDQIGATHTLLQPLHDFKILAKAFTTVERQEHT